MRKVRGKVAPLPVIAASPISELRRLVKLHKNLMTTSVRLTLMQTDRTDRETGEVSPSLLPDDIRADMLGAAEKIKAECGRIERAMLKQLKYSPVYSEFLAKVFGCGPVVSAYLVAMVRAERAVKPSNLRRYCGYGLDIATGRLERRAGGPKYAPDGSVSANATGTFNDDLRRVLWLMMGAMRRNAAKKSPEAPHGSTSKYLDVWREQKHRALSAGMPKGAADKKGMHKALDVFLEDLYMVVRASEGVEVWPCYYAAKLGYEHGGKISVNAPKMLTLAEALALVGEVGKRPAAAPIGAEDVSE